MMENTTGMFFGGGFMWLFGVLLIVVIVLVLKSVSGGSDSGNISSDESAMSILKKRYANGEIDEKEFDRRRKELES